MSIEERLEANTEALKANTIALDLLRVHLGHLNQSVSGARIGVATTPTETKVEAPKAPKPATTPADASKSTPAAAQASAPITGPAKIEYRDLQQLINTVAAKTVAGGRERVLEILAKFKVAKGPDLKESDWPEALADLQKAKGDLIG